MTKKQKPLHKKHWRDEFDKPFWKKLFRREERRLTKIEISKALES